MKINHTVAHYVIGAAALGVASFAAVKPAPAPVHLTTLHQAQKAGRFDHPGLGQTKTTDLGLSLKGVAPGKVTIYCNAASCHELYLDLDDAFQIAGWQSDLEERLVDSEADKGIFVGPPGHDADTLAAALAKVGIEAGITNIEDERGQPIAGVGIIIGKQ